MHIIRLKAALLLLHMCYQVPMDSGVRKGAASSVLLFTIYKYLLLLFNSFMDDLFEYLDERCSVEALLPSGYQISGGSKFPKLHKFKKISVFEDSNPKN